MKTISLSTLLIILILFSCNQIQRGEDLSTPDIERIQKMNLLEPGETIYKFYSEFKKKVAGNFFTNKRMAKYWMDENNPSKNEVSFAFYPDIKSIDTIYYSGATYSPFMLVTKTDNSQFKVCVDGKRSEIKSLFEDALKTWRNSKSEK